MSLLTDHYFDHHEIEINEYIQYFYDHYVSSTHKNQITYAHFHYTCTLIAIQRHLKPRHLFKIVL